MKRQLTRLEILLGREKMRENWATIFETTSNLESEILRIVEDSDTVWVEIPVSRRVHSDACFFVFLRIS